MFKRNFNAFSGEPEGDRLHDPQLPLRQAADAREIQLKPVPKQVLTGFKKPFQIPTKQVAIKQQQQ